MPSPPPAPGSGRRLAVGYLRRSTDRQEQSIADQQTALERFATEQGLTVARYYTDDALSGTSSARPAFQEMIADACRGHRPFGFVLVYDLKRFGRLDNDEAGYYRHILRTHGVEVLYASEHFSGSGTDDLLRPVKQWQAREESKDLSKVTIRGLLTRATSGCWLGGVPPYGYDLRYQTDRPPRGEFLFVLRYMRDGTKQMLDASGALLRTLGRDEAIVVTKRDSAVLVPSSPDRVAVVQRIFRLSAEENRGFRAIANVLNGEGVPTARSPKYAPHCRGVWEGATIRAILMNPIYVGDMTWNRRSEATFHRIRHGSAVERRDLVGPTVVENNEADWIRVENAHPALVSRRLFSLARLARQSRPAPGRGRSERVTGGWSGWRAQYLLSGLITCARCGGRYEGSSSGHEMQQPGGTVGRVRYYACGTTIRRGRRACVFGSVQRDVMESVVCRALTEFYAPMLVGNAEVRIAKMIAAAQSEDARATGSEHARLVEESERIDTTIANLLDNLSPSNRQLANDRITALGKDLERIERRLYDLDRIVMNAEETRATAHHTCAFLADLAGILANGGVVERITAVRKCVASIVYDSEARTAALRLFRVPGGNFRGGVAEVTLSIPSTLRQPKPQGRTVP